MEDIKLMVLDDSQQIKKMCAEEFSNTEGLRLLEQISDGEMALTAIKEQQPDIVLMDLILPNCDAMVLLEQIVKLPNAPKVIVATAITGEAFVLNAMRAGASYYFIKPCKASDLIARMYNIVNEQIVENSQQQVNNIISTFKKESVEYPVLKNKALEEKISNIFITVGIPAHIKGYQFLREAIKMAIETPEIVNSITKKLYPSIAEKFSTSASKVERAIRHAIEVAWNRGKIENINSVFGLHVYGANEKPTNGEFIALVADKMIIEGN